MAHIKIPPCTIQQENSLRWQLEKSGRTWPSAQSTYLSLMFGRPIIKLMDLNGHEAEQAINKLKEENS